MIEIWFTINFSQGQNEGSIMSGETKTFYIIYIFPETCFLHFIFMHSCICLVDIHKKFILRKVFPMKCMHTILHSVPSFLCPPSCCIMGNNNKFPYQGQHMESYIFITAICFQRLVFENDLD